MKSLKNHPLADNPGQNQLVKRLKMNSLPFAYLKIKQTPRLFPSWVVGGVYMFDLGFCVVGKLLPVCTKCTLD